jgi:mannosyltransferase
VSADLSDRVMDDRRWTLCVATLCALSAGFGLWGIGSHGLWMDEGFTASMSLQSFGDLIHIIVTKESNASLHSVLSWGLAQFGTSEVLLRAPSIAFTVATIWLLAHLGRRIVNARVGVVAAAAASVHGGLVLYSQSARTYSLATLLVLGAATVMVADDEQPRGSRVLGWTVLALLAVFAHLFAAVAVLGQLVCVLIVRPSARRRYGVPAVIVTGAALALGLVIARHEEGQELVQFDPQSIRDTLSILTGRAGLLGAVVVGGLGLVGVVLLALRARSGVETSSRFAGWLLVAMALFQPLGLAALSIVQPSLLGRFVLPSVPGLVLAAAVGVDWLLRRRVHVGRAAVVGLLSACLVGGLRVHVGTTIEDWRGVATQLRTEGQRGDRVVFVNDSVRLFFEFEHARHHDGANSASNSAANGVANSASNGAASQWPTPVFPVQPWGQFATGDQKYSSPTDADLRALATTAGRVWLVVGFIHDNADTIARAEQILGPHVSARHFDGDIDVMVYSIP